MSEDHGQSAAPPSPHTIRRVDDLQQILAAHRLWLATDGAEGTRADLHGADLRSCSLRRADLRHALLDGVDLRLANLDHALLQEASLRGAWLDGDSLWNASLAAADLVDARLRNAKLDMRTCGWQQSPVPMWTALQCGARRSRAPIPAQRED